MLFDDAGYTRFESEEEYKRFLAQGAVAGVKDNPLTNTLTIKPGIAKLPGYQSLRKL